MPLVAITRLRVRSWRYLPMFFLQALRSTRQAATAEGNLATRLLRDRQNTLWTGTIWTTEVADAARAVRVSTGLTVTSNCAVDDL